MNRAVGRWIVLGALGATVAGLTVSTTMSNRALIEQLRRGEERAFDELVNRQDAYIFLQSEPVSTRLEIAKALAEGAGSAAPALAIRLVPDPDPTVRAALIDSLTRASAKYAPSTASLFDNAGAAESSALIEASARDPEVGLRILEEALARYPSSINGYLLAKRLGSPSEPALIKMLSNKDEGVRLSAADALLSLDLSSETGQVVAKALLADYNASKSQAFKDKLLPYLARLAPLEATTIFRQTATDSTAPSNLRAVATMALVTLKDPLVKKLADDSDTAVAAAASSGK